MASDSQQQGFDDGYAAGNRRLVRSEYLTGIEEGWQAAYEDRNETVDRATWRNPITKFTKDAP